jgi:hypothetical protein
MADDETPDEIFEDDPLVDDEVFDEPDDLDADLATDDEVFDDIVDDEEEEDEVAPPTTTKARKVAEDEDEEDDEEELDPDDVEADLDEILKDRIAAQEDEDEDEDETPEPDDRGDGAGRIQPKKADEFVCQSCFLVKHRQQLADEEHMICVDCI